MSRHEVAWWLDVVATGRKLFNAYPHTHTLTKGNGFADADEGIMWHDNHITITSRKIFPTVVAVSE